MKHLFFLFTCMSILFVAGCISVKRPADLPATHQTILTFTQDGVPLEGASVTLIAQETANAKWSLGGATDSKGILKVQTQGFDGAPVGTYKITVSKIETEGTPVTAESSDSSAVSTSTGGDTKQYHLIDKKYRALGSTDLTLEVTAGKNAKSYELGPAVHELIPVTKN